VPGIAVRPLESRHVDAAHDVSAAAFDDLNRRLGEDPEPPTPVAVGRIRIGRCLATDPGGAWVAERDGEVVGCALAIVREGVWGLSLLVVRPDAQSSGAGRELLARSFAYGDDILALLEAGCELLILPERGYALVRAGGIRLLAAYDEDAAATLLRGSLAVMGDDAAVEWITSAQAWAIAPCLDAGLELRNDVGAVFPGGDVGPFAPYLPSGAYL
jgi:GNAT superfamily N-acetyltransferase